MNKSFKFGAVFAAAAGSLFLIACIIAMQTGNAKYYTFTDFIGQMIFFVGLFYTINHFKNNEGEGTLNFKTGWGVGLQYGTVFALVMALFVTAQFLIPGFIDFLIEASKKAYAVKNISPAESEKLLAEFKDNYTPFKIFTMIVFRNMLTGIVFSAVISFLLRSRN